MIVKDIDQKSIEQVFSSLWDQAKDECHVLNISVNDFRTSFEKMIKQPWAVAFWNGEKCFAVACLVYEGDYKWRSIFAATNEIHKFWMPVTRYIKRTSDFLINEAKGKGFIELFTISESFYEWYDSIGFELAASDGTVDKYIKR